MACDGLAGAALLEGHRPAAALADRAYDAGSLRRHLHLIRGRHPLDPLT
jgi:hypothetical protein